MLGAEILRHPRDAAGVDVERGCQIKLGAAERSIPWGLCSWRKGWVLCLRSGQGLPFSSETKDKLKATHVKMLQGVVPSKFKIDARSHFGRVPSALLLELWAFSQLTTEVKQWHYQSSYPKNSDWEGSLAYGLAYCLAQDEI